MGGPGSLTPTCTSPRLLHQQIAHVVRQGIVELDAVLPMVTANTDRVLALSGKGKLEPGADADVAVLDCGSLDAGHAIARGGLQQGKISQSRK